MEYKLLLEVASFQDDYPAVYSTLTWPRVEIPSYCRVGGFYRRSSVGDALKVT
jgi:hypothetical protein